MIYQLHTLSNGIRVALMPSKSEVIYIGLCVHCGSSDDPDRLDGMAHFTEHMLFKGTGNMTNSAIINAIETTGGEINAYTTREETFVYTTVPRKYTERSLRIIADIVYNSTFPEKEMNREREVIIDEINSYKDSPAENIYDEFEEIVFRNHPSAHNILGTEQSVSLITSGNMAEFVKSRYYTNQTVLFVMGQIGESRLLQMAEKYFGIQQAVLGTPKRPKLENYMALHETRDEETHQIHYITGAPAFGLHHEQRSHLFVLNYLLGGPAMNSRLNMSLREKNGIAYNVDSSYTGYANHGIFSLYFGTDERNLTKSLKIVEREMDKLRNIAIRDNQLKQIQQQIMGHFMISNENRENLFMNFGKSILHYNIFESMEQTKARVFSINSTQLLSVAQEILDPTKMSTLIFK